MSAFYDAEGREIAGARRLPPAARYSAGAAEVFDFTAMTFSISREEILAPDRSRQFSRPRMAAYWLTREVLGLSYPQIARAAKRRDHTTILHGCRETARRLAEGGEFAAKVMDMKAFLVERRAARAAARRAPSSGASRHLLPRAGEGV